MGGGFAAFEYACQRLSVGDGFEGGTAEVAAADVLPLAATFGWTGGGVGNDPGAAVSDPDLLLMCISHNKSAVGRPVDEALPLALLSLWTGSAKCKHREDGVHLLG